MKEFVEVIFLQRLLCITLLGMDIIGLPFSKTLILSSRNDQPTINFYGRMKRATMPLQPILVDAPFMKWGLDVIGPINPK